MVVNALTSSMEKIENTGMTTDEFNRHSGRRAVATTDAPVRN
jgi:hypothetical protein